MSTQTFIYQLIETCQKHPGTIILPEAEDPRTLEAAEFLIKELKSSHIILIGNPATITAQSSTILRRDLGKTVEIQNTTDSQIQTGVRAHIETLQRAKGRTPTDEQLNHAAADPLFQAGWLLSQNPTGCVVAGAVRTTADVIRAALGTVGLAPGIRTVSGGFFMERTIDGKRESYYYADAGVVVEPTSEQLVDIAAASCDTWNKIMGTKSVLAFLSFSTRGSASHASSAKVATATRMFQQRYPHIESDGEFQFDAAFVASVGARKAPGSPVPGRANIFVFPDLNSGNIAYKITQRLAGFDAYGPILQGLRQPYSDLSRGASARDIAVSAMINLLRR